MAAGTEVITDTSGNTRTHVHSYSYDMRSQLESASITNIGGSTWTASFAYNKDGNIASQTINGTPATFGYDGDLLTSKGSSSIDWNANGCMIEGLTSSLTYNWDGKLRTGSAGANSLSVKYNPMGDRIYKESYDGQTTTKRRYIVAAIDRLPVILLEIDPDDNDPNAAIKKTYLYANGQVIAQHIDDYYNFCFYLHDRLGSVRQVIDTNGTVRNKYVYEPFGQMFASEKQETLSNPFTFTGQYYDSEISQYYLRARQYDPQLYRFTARDPVKGKFTEPLTLHAYLYCLNDPIDFVDPKGESTADVLVAPIVAGYAAHALALTIVAYGVANMDFNIMDVGISLDRNLGLVMAYAAIGMSGPQAVFMALGKYGEMKGGKQGQRDHYYGYEEEPDFNKFKEWLEKMKRELFGKRGQSLNKEEMDEAWEIWDGWGRPSGGK